MAKQTIPWLQYHYDRMVQASWVIKATAEGQHRAIRVMAATGNVDILPSDPGFDEIIEGLKLFRQYWKDEIESSEPEVDFEDIHHE